MKLVFFGSAAFAVPTLQSLLAAGHQVAAVFTPPDRPAGRGGKLRATPVKIAATSLGIPCEQPEFLDAAALATLQKYAPEIVIIVAYGALIPATWLAVAPRGWFNLHPSLLPLYRGAAPVPHCILNGDAETGVTIFKLNEHFDRGEILAVKKILLTSSATSATLLDELAQLGAQLFIEKLATPETWTCTQQEKSRGKYAGKFTKADGKIDWHLPAEIIDRQVRAFQPWPISHTFFGVPPRQLSILKVAPTAHATTLPAGALVDEHGELFVSCGDKSGERKLLQIITVIPEGRVVMSAAEFLRGARGENKAFADGTLPIIK